MVTTDIFTAIRNHRPHDARLVLPGPPLGPHVRSWLRGEETLVDVLTALLLVVVMLADPETQ
jgi:hypothetical protein